MRILLLSLAILITLTALAQKTTISVHNLRTEYKPDPLGIDSRNPRFSWMLLSTQTDVSQSAYEIKISVNGKSYSTGWTD